MLFDTEQVRTEVLETRQRVAHDNEILWHLTIGLRRSDDASRASLRCWWQSQVLLARAVGIGRPSPGADGEPPPVRPSSPP